jgi:hypothetical protein
MKERFTMINDVFASLIEAYSLKGVRQNDYVYQILNDKISIIFMFERFDEGFLVFLEDLNASRQYPIWQLFDKKGNPKIEIDFSSDKFTRNLIWHKEFITKYLIKELNGDFTAVEDSN